jgi:hypothetical protein
MFFLIFPAHGNQFAAGIPDEMARSDWLRGLALRKLKAGTLRQEAAFVVGVVVFVAVGATGQDMGWLGSHGFNSRQPK